MKDPSKSRIPPPRVTSPAARADRSELDTLEVIRKSGLPRPPGPPQSARRPDEKNLDAFIAAGTPELEML
jgi:hypothetical protein